MDKIILRGIQAMGCHGVNPMEKTVKQPFSVDVILHLDLSAAAAADDLTRTVDYGEIYARVRNIVEQKRFNLVEALAGYIAQQLLTDSRIELVQVRVEKTQACAGSLVFPAAVELTRGREAQ